MSKKRKHHVAPAQTISSCAETPASLNVRALTSQRFREALDKFSARPTIDAFLRALQVSDNPVETSQLFENIGPLVSALNQRHGEDRTNRWTELWRLASVFRLIEPLNERHLYPPREPTHVKSAEIRDDHLAAKLYEPLLNIFMQMAEEDKRRTERLTELGFQSGYPKLVEFDAASKVMEPYLGFNPTRTLDAQLAEFKAARVVEADTDNNGDATAVRRLALSEEQRTLLAVAWDAACVRLLGVEPPPPPTELPIGVATDDGFDFSLPTLLLLPIALSGIGCLLIAGYTSRASQLAMEWTYRSPASTSERPPEAPAHSGTADIDQTGSVEGLTRDPSNPALEAGREALERALEGRAGPNGPVASARECPAPLASLTEWIKLAATYSLFFRRDPTTTPEDTVSVLEGALAHAPVLPPDLLAALIPYALADNFEEFQADYWDTMKALGNVLALDDPELHSKSNRYFDPSVLNRAECIRLRSLVAMSKPISLEVAAQVASRFDTRWGLFWMWDIDGDHDVDREITYLFRRFQKRLIEAETRWGHRALVNEADLRRAFSRLELPSPAEPISVRWAVELVLGEEYMEDDPEPDWLRSRNNLRLALLLHSRGLVSLAGALHCHFILSQCVRAVREVVRRKLSSPATQLNIPIIVDDWSLFVDVTRRLLESAWRKRLVSTLHLAADLLRADYCHSAFAFEARQIIALLKEEFEGDSGGQVKADVLQVVTRGPGYQTIESRLQEVMGPKYLELPVWARDALKSAERQFEIASGDRGLLSTHASSPWVLEYAKIVEMLLQTGLGILWRDPAVRTGADELYRLRQPPRPFPKMFEVGTALIVLKEARKHVPNVVADRLSRAGIDVTALSTDLGEEIRTRVSMIRNLEAHGAAPPEDAAALRHWVLKNLPRVYDALGRPRADRHDRTSLP
jgi:hypothetical protein